MKKSDNVCYYGRHIGCPYVDDLTCRSCAERLTKAVERERKGAGFPKDHVTSEHPQLFASKGVYEQWGVLMSMAHACAKLYASLLVWR